ncbi:MAG TPA: hypothetical protein VK154_06210 [Chitinophagales bacterium]|nr:hypothetical protein [Chitinophagales bacterium]
MQRLPGIYSKVEGFFMKLIPVVLVLLAPLLIYDKYFPVPSNIQAVYCILIVILAIGITIWLTIKWEGGLSNAKQIAAIDSALIEIFNVKTSRAIEREDPEDFGPAYYLEVLENGKPKTLFLWGQYFDELEEAQFPNTEFEYTRVKRNGEFISFVTLGKYFQPERILPPFAEEVWKNDGCPSDGQILNLMFDEVK